uniref:Uncharacterized protein n=1 Tax=Octopus bimaculoides TaxID=37653 RepID=A0A0L8HKJ5_OCTBM
MTYDSIYLLINTLSCINRSLFNRSTSCKISFTKTNLVNRRTVLSYIRISLVFHLHYTHADQQIV